MKFNSFIEINLRYKMQSNRRFDYYAS